MYSLTNTATAHVLKELLALLIGRSIQRHANVSASNVNANLHTLLMTFLVTVDVRMFLVQQIGLKIKPTVCASAFLRFARQTTTLIQKLANVNAFLRLAYLIGHSTTQFATASVLRRNAWPRWCSTIKTVTVHAQSLYVSQTIVRIHQLVNANAYNKLVQLATYLTLNLAVVCVNHKFVQLVSFGIKISANAFATTHASTTGFKTKPTASVNVQNKPAPLHSHGAVFCASAFVPQHHVLLATLSIHLYANVSAFLKPIRLAEPANTSTTTVVHVNVPSHSPALYLSFGIQIGACVFVMYQHVLLAMFSTRQVANALSTLDAIKQSSTTIVLRNLLASHSVWYQRHCA